MRTKLTLILMAFSIVAWAGLSVSADLVTQGRSEGSDITYVPTDRFDVQIWCQATDFLFIYASQIADDYPVEIWAADDYISPGDEAIEKVLWWGEFFNDGFQILPEAFVISFFNHDGSCDPGVPSLLIAQRIVTDYTATDLGIVNRYEFEAEVDPVLQDAGRTYWISIQAVMPFYDGGQWAWANGFAGLVNGCSAVKYSPGAPFNIDVWTPLENGGGEDVDLGFCLYYEGDNPIADEAISWGAMKALYK